MWKNISKRKKKLVYAGIGLVLLLAVTAGAALFSSFIEWSGSYEVTTPVLQYSTDSATGPWDNCEDFVIDLGTNTGSALNMGYTDQFWIASGGAITVSFTDNSGEGVTINMYHSGDLVNPITTYEFTGSVTEEFYIEVLVSPMLATGSLVTAELIIDANGL